MTQQTSLFDDGEKILPRETLEQWHREMWRKPDRYTEATGYVLAIWYGPGGRKGEHATVVELSDDEFEVSEYNDTAGYYDVGDEPSDPFQVRTVALDPEVVLATLKHFGITAKNRRELVRWVAGLGVAHSGYWGGEESTAEELP